MTVALCPACHAVKHLGMAGIRGRRHEAVAHLAKVNGWSADDAELYVEAVFERWAHRSRHPWSLDLSVLEERYGVRLEEQPPADPAG